MLKNLLFTTLLATGSLSAFADTIPVTTLLQSSDFILRKPILIDSVNVKKESFSDKMFLNGDLPVGNISFEPIDATSDGFFTVNKPGSDYQVSYYRFYIRSDRYANATLQIKTPGLMTLYVDGAKKSDKTTQQDSLCAASVLTSDITFEPGQKEITLKYLVSSQSTANPQFQINVIPAAKDSAAVIEAGLSGVHPLTIEDLMTGSRTSRPTISSDGKFALVQETLVLKDGKRINSKRVVRTADGSPIMDVSDKSDIKWMPTSATLSYTTTGLYGRELRVIDPVSRNENTLASNLPAGSFTWSPDETYLIYSIVTEFPASKSDLQLISTPDDRQPGWKNRYSLYRYTIADGLMEQLTFGYHNTWLNDISSDSKNIIFAESETFMTERPFRRQSFYQLNLNTFSVDTLWYQVGFLNAVSYSPDQTKLLVQGSAEAFDGIGLNIKPGQIANMYDGQVYIYDRKTRQIEAITKDFNPCVNNAQWNKLDNKIYLQCTDRDFVDVYSFDPAKRSFTRLPMNVEVVSGFDLASNAPAAVYGGQSTSYPEQIYAYNLKNNRSSLLLDPQKEQSANYELGEVRDWNFVSTDGTTIEGRYYLPVGFDPQKKYPMIVYYYSGTTPTDRSFFHPYSMHLYAAQGYVVYTLQPSGTIGYGQEFAARHVNAWGIQTADDIICGVKKFCEEHPFVNASKVGCMGASYGGFMTMYLQTRTDIFAAAVSHAGISSLSSYWGEGFWGYSYSAAASAHSYPWNNPELYIQQSPLFHADKVNTPILLLHGKVDTNVPVGESIQMFTALRLLGKQVDFIEVAGENHGIMDFNRRIAWKKSIFAFFAKWLKDEPQWWESQYPLVNLE